MSTTDNIHSQIPPVSGSGERPGKESIAVTADWVDANGGTWRVTLAPDRIILQGGDEVVELPGQTWTRDILIATHGSRFVFRFETFEKSIAFAVTPEQAGPVLAHLGISLDRHSGDEASSPQAEEQPTGRGLLWPKVSPLAVWALICSALSFVPFVGLLPALVAVVLLILHRVKVRRVAAMRHSRIMCAVAFAFLVVGVGISVVTIMGMRHFGEISEYSSLFVSSAQEGRNWGLIAVAIFVVVLSLSVHEAGHAISAWWLGDGYARSLGRVTLNPLAHIDPFGTVLLPLMLAYAGLPVFGYAKPVPVQVATLRRYRRAHILVSIAGPGANLLLASASLTLLLGASCGLRLAMPEVRFENLASVDLAAMVKASGFALAGVVGPLLTILKLSFIINIFLATFNMIPIPPLDGSWVLEHLFPSTLGPLYATIRPYGFLIFLGAIYAGMFEYLIYPVSLVLGPALILLARATGT